MSDVEILIVALAAVAVFLSAIVIVTPIREDDPDDRMNYVLPPMPENVKAQILNDIGDDIEKVDWR